MNVNVFHTSSYISSTTHTKPGLLQHNCDPWVSLLEVSQEKLLVFSCAALLYPRDLSVMPCVEESSIFQSHQSQDSSQLTLDVDNVDIYT